MTCTAPLQSIAAITVFPLDGPLTSSRYPKLPVVSKAMPLRESTPVTVANGAARPSDVEDPRNRLPVLPGWAGRPREDQGEPCKCERAKQHRSEHGLRHQATQPTPAGSVSLPAWFRLWSQ